MQCFSNSPVLHCLLPLSAMVWDGLQYGESSRQAHKQRQRGKAEGVVERLGLSPRLSACRSPQTLNAAASQHHQHHQVQWSKTYYVCVTEKEKGGGAGKVAGFVLKPLLCQTCARASAAAAAAAAPLRCVSALAERRTQPRGEGRQAEKKSGATETQWGTARSELHRRTLTSQQSVSKSPRQEANLCGARQSFSAWRLR